ncbi:MAG: response regulator, partial [Clostridia bacterium]|nr:response regulator [Clostridia bacterium]
MQYRVFLVDDEIAIREGIRNSRLWDDSRFVLAGEAPDGEIALSMIGDIRPDILVTDVRMPFMDGMQLVTEVSQQMPWTQVIILSGYDDFNYARRAMSLGVQEYLLKPVSASDLKEALERAAGRLER